jgi:glutathione S-transferase
VDALKGRRNDRKAIVNSKPAVLITIPLSHYCEKARWALDRVGLPYREEAHAPLLHRLATRRYRGGSVPILVHKECSLVDSRAILEFANSQGGDDRLYPRNGALRQEVLALEEQFDSQLGPHTRRWAYGHLLAHPALLRAVWSRGVPRVEAIALSLILPVVRRLVRSAYRVTEQGTRRSLERVRECFGEVEQRLVDGRPYLVAGRFTAADLSFAALAAPVLLPVESGAVQPEWRSLPAAMQAEIAGFRRSVAGQFALRMFAEERGLRQRGKDGREARLSVMADKS